MSATDEAAHGSEIDLVVATIGRQAELTRFIHSVKQQAPVGARVIVVDQNPDDRLDEVLVRERELEIVHLRAAPSASRARSIGQAQASAPVVAWPDDDCVYPDELLRHVLETFE